MSTLRQTQTAVDGGTSLGVLMADEPGSFSSDVYGTEILDISIEFTHYFPQVYV